MVEAVVLGQPALADHDAAATVVHVGDVAEGAAEHDEEPRRSQLLHRDQGDPGAQLGDVADAGDGELLVTVLDGAHAGYGQGLPVAPVESGVVAGGSPVVVDIRREDLEVARGVDGGSRVQNDSGLRRGELLAVRTYLGRRSSSFAMGVFMV